MVSNTIRPVGQALVLLVMLTGSLALQAAGDPARGKTHFQLCIACHGPNAEGNKILNAPATAGQYQWYLARQLKNFKAGIRGAHPEDVYGAQMRPMAIALPDEQAIEDVAAYISELAQGSTLWVDQ